MKEKQIKRIHLVYGIIATLLIISLGAWAIASCMMIYKSSETERFLPEKIFPYLFAFTIPLTISVAAILVGAVLHAVYPPKEEKAKAFVSDKDLLKKLYSNLDMKNAPLTLKNVIKSQRSFRRAFLVILLINIAVNTFCGIVYLFTNPLIKAQLELFTIGNGEFPYWTLPPETNLEFKAFFPIICATLAYAIIPFFVAIVYDIFARFTYEKELEAVKAIYAFYAKNGKPISLDGEEEVEEKEEFKGDGVFGYDLKNNFVKIVKYSVLCFSILFIVLGIINGLLDGTLGYVLTNAIKICFGCVGLS